MYENAPFWKRFLSNFLDFVIVFSFSALIVFFATSSDKESFTPNFYNIKLPILLIILLISAYYLLTPIITKGKTLMMLVFRIKIIDNSNKKFKVLSFLKRNIVGCYVWILIFLISVIFFSPLQLSEMGNIKESDNTLSILNVFKNVIGYFISIWFVIMAVNYIIIIKNSKRNGVSEVISGTRVVNWKIVQESKKIQDIPIYPFYKKYRNIVYYQVDKF
ncbi:RDD family protein [Mycoplasmopsis gallinacea]|uniref:RDD family protein n=1 Tax=Mycoplasmopsis gallinacea TaxID=29556 RepID=A0A449A282_9BACT|nr:RDD family protein [Mycoplasmopsis gallinacea]VEU58365.1 RDD family protein [Mycoplasmopsis gallinacea]